MTDTYPYEPGGAGQPDVRESSVSELASRVTGDLSDLVRQELELAKAELRQEARRTGKGAGLLGGAGVAGHIALLFLSVALMFLLDRGLPIGWAAFLVGVLYVVVAALLAMVGRRELAELSGPEKTTKTVKEDARWLANRTK